MISFWFVNIWIVLLNALIFIPGWKRVHPVVSIIFDTDRIFVVVLVIGFPAGRVAPCPTS